MTTVPNTATVQFPTHLHSPWATEVDRGARVGTIVQSGNLVNVDGLDVEVSAFREIEVAADRVIIGQPHLSIDGLEDYEGLTIEQATALVEAITKALVVLTAEVTADDVAGSVWPFKREGTK